MAAHVTREGSTFKKEVQSCTNAIVRTLLKIHSKIAMEFLPTSIKFHYQFNLRDLTNVISGVMKMKGEHFKDGPTHLVQLLMHECERVYCDRLCEQEDKDPYVKLVSDIVRQELATITVTDPSRPKTGGSSQISVNMDNVFQHDVNYFSNFALGIGEGSYAPL